MNCGNIACDWQVNAPTRAEAFKAWNARAESEVYGNGWAVKTKWNSVPHIFHDQRDAERFAYNEKSEVIKVKYVRDE